MVQVIGSEQSLGALGLCRWFFLHLIYLPILPIVDVCLDPVSEYDYVLPPVLFISFQLVVELFHFLVFVRGSQRVR